MAELLQGRPQRLFLFWLVAAVGVRSHSHAVDARFKHSRPLRVVQQRADVVHQRGVGLQLLADATQRSLDRCVASPSQTRDDGVCFLLGGLRGTHADLLGGHGAGRRAGFSPREATVDLLSPREATGGSTADSCGISSPPFALNLLRSFSLPSVSA